MKEKKRIKKKVGVGSVVKANVGEMEYNTRDLRSRRTIKEVVVCVKYVLGKKILLFQLGAWKKKNMSSILIAFLGSKKEVDMDEPLSNSTKNNKANSLLLVVILRA